MNREIKFRAWDKENKKMIYDFANFSSGNVIDVPEGRWSHELRLTNKNEIKASLNFKSNDTFETKCIEYIPAMQYTGLKDKNGVEIYEGDIVERMYIFKGEYGETHMGEVVYDKERARYVISRPKKHIEPKTEDLRNTLSEKCTYEVIGNIYEDKKLLECESK